MDERLTFKAKGILLYLMSRPDDWQVYEQEIIKHSKDGIKAVRNGIDELIEYGYIKRNLIRDEQGHFKGYEYLVYDKPAEVPKSENGKTDFRKGHTTNIDSTNTDVNQNNDNGANSNEICPHISIPNDEVSEAMKVYMSDLYKQKTGKEHPALKRDQFVRVHDTISAFADENGLDSDGIVDMMLAFINSKAIKSDWNINHFATEGIMMNRFYEECY